MKKTLTKQLAAYSSMVGVMLLNKNEVNAQIVYVNPPDIVFANGELKLDLDNNGIVDYDIFNGDESSGGGAHFIGMEYSNSLILGYPLDCAFTFYSYRPKIIKPGKKIGNAVNWHSILAEPVRFCFDDSYANCNFIWAGKHNKFIGLRFFSNPSDPQSAHYAWMRVSVNDDCNVLVIHDWAFNSVANQPIFAGQMVKEEADSTSNKSFDPEIFSYGKTINIKNFSDDPALDVEIYNNLGQRLKTLRTQDDISSIEVNDFAPGVYIVHASGKVTSVSKRIMIE